MTAILRIAGLMLVALAPFAARAESPLSASEWLSGSVRNPPREISGWRAGDQRPDRMPGPRPDIPPVATTAAVGKVDVRRLDSGDPDRIGTISARQAGLPADLWAGSDPAVLGDLLAQTPARLPAMNALLRQVLIAQLDPPPAGTLANDAASADDLFLARTDRLLDMGDLDAARDLLEAAGPGDAERFRRLFDIALLEGNEFHACEIMDKTPGIAPSFSARIFCMAQSGDWAGAALVLHGTETLKLIPPARLALLRHFLDDSYVDGNEMLEPPATVTPLDYRMLEAVGQPLPTPSLPLAFAHSDLRDNNGWKARLEAAERLAKAGVLPPARLRAIYAEQQPAASGGVWDRAAALRVLEQDLAQGGDAGGSLERAAQVFAEAQMSYVLAAMLGDDLQGFVQDPGASKAARQASLLRQWIGQGEPAGIAAAATVPDAVIRAEDRPVPTDRKGEALLHAMADIDAGLDGDLARAGRGLAMLEALGLGVGARLAAGQLNLITAADDDA